jgi:hypothetical protein
MIYGDGFAICHPEDKDYQSRITGLEIAQARASIDLAQQINAYELKPALKTLEHLRSTMDHGGSYNEESPEWKRLEKEIDNYRKDIEFNKKFIQAQRDYLRWYIDGKDALYKELRSKKDNAE